MSIRLMVNADDYGHSPGVSAGIREAHLHGIVTSTTTMMNMPGVEDALHEAIQEYPDLGLGVHLNLTTGHPLLAADQLNSLIDGNGCFPGESELIARLPVLDLAQVRYEWQAQVEKFVDVTGKLPDHLDSHHHVSYLSPGLFRIMLELAKEYGSAIRFPNQEVAMDMLSDFPVEYAQDCLETNLELLKQFKIPHPHYFIKSFYGEKATIANLRLVLANLSEGTTEMMCHPGYVDHELMTGSVYHLQREKELAILTDQSLLAFIKERRIELINARGLGV
jgi:predicted glycoside hydrolase/deacetylase ChbG (UPF0249 family)